MSADPATAPLLTTSYRPDLGVLVSRWGFQPEPSLLPATYEQLAADAQASGCRCWLQDIRRRTFNDPATTHWLVGTYFPQMAARLGGRLHVAYLAGPTLMEKILSGPDFLPPSAYAHMPFVVAFFGDEGEAVRWLHEEYRQRG